jgi:hypothetical protein
MALESVHTQNSHSLGRCLGRISLKCFQQVNWTYGMAAFRKYRGGFERVQEIILRNGNGVRRKLGQRFGI